MGGSEWISYLASYLFYGSLVLALGTGILGLKNNRSGLYFLAGFFAILDALFLLGYNGIFQWVGVAFVLTAFAAGLLARRRDQRPARFSMLLGLALAFFTIYTIAMAERVSTGSENAVDFQRTQEALDGRSNDEATPDDG